MKKNNYIPLAQTTRLASFGPVFLIAAFPDLPLACPFKQ
jgi:hypothetical protein